MTRSEIQTAKIKGLLIRTASNVTRIWTVTLLHSRDLPETLVWSDS